MREVKRVRAPVRIDFAGGTTDISPFKDKFGGAVLNAGINRYVVGKIVKTPKMVHLEYTGHTPTSSGLGTSGVMNLVWLYLISNIKLKNKGKYKFKTRGELAEMVYDLEQSQGLIGGKQDQYVGAFGGINLMEFKGDKVKVIPLRIKRNIVKELEKNLVLVYTGKPHFSGNTNKSMLSNFRSKVDILKNIKAVVYDMRDALVDGRLDRFAELMNVETENRDKLDKSIIPPKIWKIINEGKKNGAVSAKVCGSGGGGCVLFYGNKGRLKKKFKGKVIDFKFDFDGLKIL